MLSLEKLSNRYSIKDNKERIMLSLVTVLGLLASQLKEKFILSLEINIMLFSLFYGIGLLLINFERTMQPAPKHKALPIVLTSTYLLAYFSSLVAIEILD